MYKVSKRLEIAGSHNLQLNYDSKCKNIHGHNWIITIYCQREILDENGMVVDFKTIKNLISEKLDHKHLNDVVKFNPTAENLAKWMVEQIPYCYKAKVQESEGNIAQYEI